MSPSTGQEGKALRAGQVQRTPRRSGAEPSGAAQRGALLAFVGPQATGKSTLLRAIEERFREDPRFLFLHLGKPPATWLTYLPKRLIPLARIFAPGKSTGSVERERGSDDTKPVPALYLVRKCMLAWERRALLRRMERARRRGKVVLSDRFPGDNPGAVDGPSFTPGKIAAERSTWKRWAMGKEVALYSGLAAADVVFELHVPVEVAVERNRTRNKLGDETDEYIRFRHSAAIRPEFGRSKRIELDTSRSLEATLAAVFEELESWL